jgi:hypothetical protein
MNLVTERPDVWGPRSPCSASAARSQVGAARAASTFLSPDLPGAARFLLSARAQLAAAVASLDSRRLFIGGR